MSASPSPPPAHDLALTSWLAACASNPWEPLTEQAAIPYTYIWQSWIRHLGDANWRDATGIQVAAFINSIEQSRRANTAPTDTAKRRYWRIIDRIYEHGIATGLCENNPAQDVSDSDLPPPESPIGATLSPRMLAALESSLPAPTDAITSRDRALMLVIIHMGLTTQEVCALKSSDLSSDGMHISGPRKAQARTIPIPEPVSQAIAAWLAHRSLFGASALSDFLFASRGNHKLRPATVQHTATRYMRLAAWNNKIPEPVQLGAQIIRNTRITHWLIEKRPITEVLSIAGLKAPSALSHLRHALPAALRAVIASSGAGSD